MTKITHSGPGIGFLDTRYVNITGDTMTGALVITPTADTTSIFNVTQADTTSVFNVDTTNAEIEIPDGAKLILGTGGDGQIYSSGDDLYIKNVTQDQDISFNVNDGGVDKQALFIQGTTGRVGIGTTGPGTKLDVNGSLTLPADGTNGLRFGTLNPQLVTKQLDDITCYPQTNDNNMVLRVSPKGTNVYGGLIQVFYTDFVADNVNYWGLQIGTDKNGNSNGVRTIYRGSQTVKPIKFGSTTGGVDTDWVTISTTGNVGIGTTGPSAPLHINTSSATPLYITGSDASWAGQHFLATESTAKAYLQLSRVSAANTFLMYLNNTDDSLNFDTSGGGTENKLTILQGGNVGIGVTAPLAKLHIDQATADAAIPVLSLDQADISDGFINFIGATAASAAGPISSWTTGNAIQGFVRVEINGVQRWLAHYSDPTG